jgi:hypothetical protein
MLNAIARLGWPASGATLPVEHFKSKEAYRKNLAYRHMHDIPFTAKEVVVGGKKHAVKHTQGGERAKIDAAQRQKADLEKYSGSVSSYKHSRPTRKVVKRTFGNA